MHSLANVMGARFCMRCWVLAFHGSVFQFRCRPVHPQNNVLQAILRFPPHVVTTIPTMLGCQGGRYTFAIKGTCLISRAVTALLHAVFALILHQLS